MRIPEIGEEPGPEWHAAFAKLPLREQLDITLVLAERLNAGVTKTFPKISLSAGSRIEQLSGRTVDEMIAMGNKNIADLQEIGFSINPSMAIDALEPELAMDEKSRRAAALAMSTARGART